ncbi:MAG: polyphosphate kinase 1 [Gammaproteobacteria bacterium]|nr:polyphosphate kinase 1 [Gammaproteobacteria bacterium]MDH3506117.1 polyphosphate kinase 1 [Gammaproteobacteria bacterium]
MDTPNLGLPDYYVNRELAQLEFNARVLHQAKDESVPLLERLKFLCICSTNLDEFFEIRVSGLKQRLEISSAAVGRDNLSPAEVLRRIFERTTELVAEQYRVLNEELIPALRDSGIRFLRRDEWTPEQRQWLQDYFHAEVEPVLSPTALDPTRPFPRILNKSLNFIVDLHGRDAFGRQCRRAIVQAPRSLPRLIPLPAELGGSGETDFVFLSSIIHAFVDELFTGMSIDGCYQFRVTRNSDLYIDDEEVDDLMRALEGELSDSGYGAAVRLEMAHDCPGELADYLLEQFYLGTSDLYRVEGPVNLNRLLAVSDLVSGDDLKYPPFTPGLPKQFVKSNIFEVIAKEDVLLHHPYESFAPVIDLVHRASGDPNVLAIKQTLYRTTPDSPIVASLVAAARAGKEVTVMIELRARFDEAANIELANKLQEAGAHTVYGVVGYKTHCKMVLIVRRESGKIRRYVHLGTGNYHPKTARAYSDYGLFSADEKLTEDVHEVFMQITSLTKTAPLNLLHQSPFTLHDGLLQLIKREIRNVAAGGTGHIIAKINALVEPEIIRALYEASLSGVHVDLIVRGVCCLRPGIPGLSENIRVRSIIGRFLEHSRCYYFHNDGDEEVYCASADWMDRNFFRRIEIMFPIRNPQIKQRLIGDLDLYLADNTQAWQLRPNGEYELVTPGMDAPVCAQSSLLGRLAESA